MRMNMKIKKKEIILFSVYLLLTFGVLLFLNQRTVFTGDDYKYNFFFEQEHANENSRWLEGISDIPKSLENHYNVLNGRIVSHALVMFFMLFDKTVFDICNSLMFLLVGILLLYHIEMDLKQWKAWYLGGIYLVMWICFPAFGASVLWVSGSCNYLWMVALTLMFLIPFQRYTNIGELKKFQLLKCVMIIPLGLISGCSKENSGGAMVLIAVLFMAYWIWQKKKIPLWSLSGVMSAFCGVAILLFAPSGKGRMEISNLGVYLKRLREVIGFSYHYILPLLIVLIIVSIMLIRQNRKKAIRILIVPFIWCLGGAASVLVLLASPSISGRSWIWAVCFIIIAIGKVCRELDFKSCKSPMIIKAAIMGLIAIACLKGYFAVRDINRTYYEFQEQILILNEQKAQGIMDVKIPMLTVTENEYNATYHLPALTPAPGEWFNQWMALYYEVDSITGIPR